ncbi:hypothetical protein C2869_12545 [Saccharobesus litoralis]|uniref:Methyl-accepting chemotaxis protein n=1 Tax=Saccharobesus litoralis TaxID=2172099 RepID=A0A2S0VSM5_9ALTE|nr:methyl-accepting chemotaxis protein [Saccharobesus litoralis]AWB67214.1 hypothetical protein C2869_12545 [Saccharobesus litoralis]
MGIFSFGIGMANRFSFSVKFLLIGAVFTGLMLYAGGQIYFSTANDIGKLNRELMANDLLKQLRPMLYAPERSTIASWRRFEQKMAEADVTVSNKTRTNLNQVLGDDDSNISTRFNGLNTLHREILASSGLKSDADHAAHFFIEIAYLQHPKLAYLMEVLQENTKQVVSRGSFTPDSFLALTDSQNQVLQLLHEVELDVQILTQERPETAKLLSRATELVEQFATMVKARILDPDTIAINISQLQSHITQVDDAMQKILAISTESLETSLTERLAAKQSTQVIILALFTSFGGFTLYILLCIGKSIRVNADLVSRYTNAVAGGDLSQSLSIPSNDSLGEIGNYLNATVNELHSKIQQIDLANQHIQTATNTVGQSVRHSFMQVEEQQTQTELVAAATEQMASTVSEVANNAETAALATKSANDAAHKGRDFVFATIDKIDTLANDINLASEAINHLQQEVLKISSVLEVITTIADQTNLLALNAAIEAARAGEHGRGFAVVAEEVRSLAQKTQTSTEEISKMISTLQQGAKTSVDVMDNSQISAKQSVDMITQAGEMLDNIQKAIEEINEQNAQVATATEEQSMVAKEISNNTENLKVATKQITDCIEQIVESNSGLESDAHSLSNLVSAFKLRS